jgi:hypothetical protein
MLIVIFNLLTVYLKALKLLVIMVKQIVYLISNTTTKFDFQFYIFSA